MSSPTRECHYCHQKYSGMPKWTKKGVASIHVCDMHYEYGKGYANLVAGSLCEDNAVKDGYRKQLGPPENA